MPEPFVFGDVAEVLDDRDVQQLLRYVSTDTLALALRGAPAELVELFKRNLSERQLLNLEDGMSGAGKQTLSKVEAAQDEIVAEVARLSREGEIRTSGLREPLQPTPSRTYGAPASASPEEARLITTAAGIADRVRRQGLLALEPDLDQLGWSPLFRRCLALMIDGHSDEWITEVLDAGFVEQRHELEREQRLLRSAVEMIYRSSTGRDVADHLSDLLGRP